MDASVNKKNKENNTNCDHVEADKEIASKYTGSWADGEHFSPDRMLRNRRYPPASPKR